MQKQKKVYYSNAFTLAEVLITLAIMGTVMALTIPTLFQSTNQASFIDGLKKTYGILDTATNQIMSNNAGTLIGAFTSSTDARDNKYGNILEYNKTCSVGSVVGNCWANFTGKLSIGASVESFDANTNYQGAVLADGTFLLFYIPNISCNGTGVSLNLPYAATDKILCGYIVADVNGFNGPNIIGKDIFMFLLGSNGLYAGGEAHTIYNAAGNCNTKNTLKDGYGCASQVLNRQEINYST